MCMLKCYVLTMLLSFVVLYDNAISFDTATTHTPVRSNRLWNFLMGYSSQRKICQGFRDRFKIGISKPFTQNHDKRPRRVHNREELVKKLNVELENGRILGPYSSLPVKDLVVSPLYVIPKSTPGKFRLIHNLSYPESDSVNSHIDEDDKSVKYCSLLDVARFLVTTEGDGHWLSKVDLKDAYRCVPIHKDDWRYLGMQLQDKYLCDRCLPMGLGSSCRIFTEISNALAWIFTQHNPKATVFNYLDDFLIVARDKQQCEYALQSFLNILNDIGFPVSDEKTVLPCQSLEYLGLGVNAKDRSFFIPANKREDAISLITSFLEKKSQKVRTIQKVVGKLTFLAQSLLPGRALLRSLHEQLEGVLSQETWVTRRISSGVKEDLMVWRQFLVRSTAEKKFRFLFPEDRPDHTIETDAAGSIGYGAVMGDRWFCGRWEDKWWTTQNIALLELYPVYAALHSWIPELSNSCVRIMTDNMALVSMLNSLYSKDRKLNTLLKHCALLLMEYNVVIKAHHIPTEANTIPDRLSRGLDCSNALNNENKFFVPFKFSPQMVKCLLI